MTDSEVILGNEVIVSYKIGDTYYPIGCGISCQFELEQEIILRTGVNDGLFPKKRVRQTDWRGTVSGVIVTDSNSDRMSPFYMIDEAVRRAEGSYQFSFTDISGTETLITGTAIIKSQRLTGDVEAFAKFDLEIEGTGAFTKEISSSPSDPMDENVDSDYWLATSGEYSVTGDSENAKNTTGKTLLAVSREGVVYKIITSGTPGNGEAKFDTSNGTTSFLVELAEDEVIWQMWKD